MHCPHCNNLDVHETSKRVWFPLRGLFKMGRCYTCGKLFQVPLWVKLEPRRRATKSRGGSGEEVEVDTMEMDQFEGADG